MEHISKLRQVLALTMQEYCRKTNASTQVALLKLNEKYNVTSRADLTEIQLEEAIESYRA